MAKPVKTIGIKTPAEFCVARCQKCGGKDISREWHHSNSSCPTGLHSRESTEHLHYECNRCGFDWTGKTLDQVISEWRAEKAAEGCRTPK